jgi:hypothetical protein
MRDSIAISYLEAKLPTPSVTVLPQCCGPAALSALFGLEAISSLPPQSLNGGRGLNRRDMEHALLNLGLKFNRRQNCLPQFGLCLVQWEGPWIKRSYRGNDLIYTHWITVAHGYIFDVNWAGWLPVHIWEETVAADLIRCRRNATSWRPHTSYDFGFLQ